MRSRAIVVAAVFASALVSGCWLMQAGYAGTAVNPTARARLFNEVLARVERSFVDTVDEDDLYRKAVDGLLLELHDPHSAYLPPDRLAQRNPGTTGPSRCGGIPMGAGGRCTDAGTPDPRSTPRPAPH